MTGLIFTGGEGPFPEREILEIIKDASITVAADSGLHLAEKFNIKPDFILGDMDSIGNVDDILKKYPKESIFRYKEDKDFTDTELALLFLAEKGCKKTIIIGGAGARTDHFLGIFCLFFRAQRPDIWVLKEEIAWNVEGKFSLSSIKGETISFFPLSEECRMKSAGLKWELDSLIWKIGDAGISNIALGDKIEIEMTKGRLLLVKNVCKQEYR
ncbi:MAG: thiamine diphosphokinase [Spirochaetes bacterium]|nr:thiamine diphosphokinase [Spirochaetota bacterium]